MTPDGHRRVSEAVTEFIPVSPQPEAGQDVPYVELTYKGVGNAAMVLNALSEAYLLAPDNLNEDGLIKVNGVPLLKPIGFTGTSIIFRDIHAETDY